MQIKFVYKNKDKDGNPILYDIVEGMTLTENYGETLDSATLIINHVPSSEKLDIEPYDEVILHDESNDDELGYHPTGKGIPDKYMCIDSYSATMLNIAQDNEYYRYDIKLFSQTKLLENKVLPNLSITPLKTGTKRTVWFYLDLYLSLYGQKLRIKDSAGNIVYSNKFTFADRVKEKFNSVECPETQMTHPTLRECLTQLMMIKDCIPIVSNNVIDFIDIGARLEPIKNTPINYITESQSASDYISSIKMNVRNIIQEQTYKGYDLQTAISKYNINLISREGGFFNDKDLCLETTYPILKINKFDIWYSYAYTGEYEAAGGGKDYKSAGVFATRDILQFMKEYNFWKTLNIAPSIDSIALDNYPNFQNTTVNYTRYSNQINNFSGQTIKSTFWPEYINQTWEAIENYILEKTKQLYSSLYAWSDAGKLYYQALYDFSYIPSSNAVILFDKEENVTTERETIDNQNNSFINPIQQGKFSQSKVNRFGNKIKMINARYDRSVYGQELFYVGWYMNDNEIVSQATYQIYKNCVLVNAQLVKNFVLKNYFTGINAKLRSWKIVDTDEALTREEIIKHFIDIDYHVKNDTCCLFPEKTKIVNTILTPKHVTMSFVSGDNHYEMDTINIHSGRSRIFSFKFLDNFVIAKYRTGNPLMPFPWLMLPNKIQYYKYGDNNGELFNFEIWIYNGYATTFCKWQDKTVDGRDIDAMKSFAASHRRNYAQAAWFKPLTPVENYTRTPVHDPHFEENIENLNKISFDNKLHKDNKEILSFNLQFEYCKDNPNILIGDFASAMSYFNSETVYPRNDFKMYIFKDINLNPNYNIKDLPDLATNDHIEVNNFSFGEDNISRWKIEKTAGYNGAVYLYNSKTQEVCFAFNQCTNLNDYEHTKLVEEEGDYIYIYFNLLRSRNKKIYSRVVNPDGLGYDIIEVDKL